MQPRKSPFIVWLTLAAILAALMLMPAMSTASTFKILHKFVGPDGTEPEGRMIFDSAGNLYGTASAGGQMGGVCESLGCGTVFKLSPNPDRSWTETVLRTFTGGADGWGPDALIFDAAGNLYGTTFFGGLIEGECNIGCGIVFKLTPNGKGSWTESVLHRFDGNDGAYPTSLLFDKAGNLFGTSLYGGATGSGVVFKLAPSADGSWTESVLHSFEISDGEYPNPGLVFDAMGNLYGTTSDGGAGELYGNIFKLSPNPDGTWTEAEIYAFCHSPGCSDGSNPHAGLVVDAAGNLYGTTLLGGRAPFPYGDGTVFKLTPSSGGGWDYNVLHVFGGKPSKHPYDGLVLDDSGNLFGTTFYGGAANDGTVFRLTPDASGTSAFNVLHVFMGAPSELPVGNLVLDGSGNLFGTTLLCKSACLGVIYEITP